MDCVSNNNVRTVKGDNFEVKQVEPNKKSVNEYMDLLTSSTNNKNVLEIALLSEQLKTANDKEKEELENKMTVLSRDISSEFLTIQKAQSTLVLGTLKGSFIEEGYFRKDGKDQELSLDFIESLPKQLFELLYANANDLIKTPEAIEKN